MDHRRFTRGLATLERIAYGFAIKKAVRLAGLFRRREDGCQTVVVLRLPAGTDMKEYEIAAGLLIFEAPDLARAALVAPKLDRKGKVDATPIFAELRSEATVIVVWPAEHDLPNDVALATERVIDVDPVRPLHLVAAAKALNGQIIDLKDAEEMLQYPAASLFAAFRPGRSAADVLRRLREINSASMAEDKRPVLDDMVGYGEAKSWAFSLAEDIRAWRDGRLQWADVDRGLLLSGAPGTGKTLFAGALARCCEAHLVATSVGRWQSAGHLGATLAEMRRSFEDAIATKPSILFIDEIDGIGNRASFVGGKHELYWTQVVNLLLELIDGHERLEGVVVLGATNFPDRIDPALVRAGRLDRHIQISLPDLSERRELARNYFGNTLSATDLDRIASATPGYSGADFEKVGRDVRRVARRASREVALEDVLDGLPKATPISGNARRTVALHEAGHAIVGVHLGVGILKMVAVPWEVRPPSPTGFAHFKLDDDIALDREAFLARIAMILGGRAAEEELLGTAYDGAGGVDGSDLHMASDIATVMQIQLGMGEGLSYLNVKSIEQRDLVRQRNPEVAARVERILSRQMERSREIVRRFRTAVEAVADVLEKSATIEGDEVVRILRETSS